MSVADMFTPMRKVLAIPTLLFVAFGIIFIFRTSGIGVDGNRYFMLFDDAMISMRYAWNFAHGHGLVWYPGNYIQGYSNLLMTLLMALPAIFLDRSAAVLAVQLFGLFLVPATAFLMDRIVDRFLLDKDTVHRKTIRLLVFCVVLFYYPLAYWSLFGMETGLLTFLTAAMIYFALQFERSSDRRSALWMGICAGAAFLTRNESATTTVLVFAFLMWRLQRERNIRRHLGALVVAAAIFAVCVIGELGFQRMYYGEFLPNTYTLKVAGFALIDRVRNGVAYSAPFVLSMSVMIIVAVIGVLSRPRAREVLLLGNFGVALAYQIYVGGDAWPPYWRFTTPTTPLLTTIFVIAVDRLLFRVQQRSLVGAPLLTTIFVVAGLAASTWPFFLHRLKLATAPREFSSAAGNADDNYRVKWLKKAMALREVLKEDASIGVISAGVIPYYSDDTQPRRTVDFLGKVDRKVASLPPHMEPYVNLWTSLFWPGHNKYDLTYSIEQLQPDFIQGYEWRESVKPWAAAHYVRVKYKGVELILLRDSKNVRWELLPKTMLPL
ncbi:MAG: hypothetical protein NTZ50_11405 [Chloroflexi bacterium]|nr:hypothetical protein [Chloroflexota bacterium]